MDFFGGNFLLKVKLYDLFYDPVRRCVLNYLSYKTVTDVVILMTFKCITVTEAEAEANDF